jgi:hypothetical protein
VHPQANWCSHQEKTVPILILSLFIGTALIRLGIALVWVSVLTTALAASGAVIALLLAVIGWQTWKRR